ncbi:hypothetical protein JYT74_00540 [Crocinitomix catalasitica]|nr:hypothetical protein [Crocinitomix catalasitica]
MKQTHLGIAALGFMMTLISLYFGVSVWNAQEFFLIDHLNQMDKLNYFKPEEIPMLNRQAAIMTFPFIFLIAIGEIRILWKAKHRFRRNIAYGMIAPVVIILVLEFLIFNDPAAWNFSLWGYVLIIMGFFLVVGNAICLFVPVIKSKSSEA